MIGPVSAFLQCVGFYHIVLMTDERMKSLAMAAFLLSCFGMIAGGAYHSHCAYLGLLGDDRFRDALAVVETYFQKFPLLYYAGDGIGFLLLAILIGSGDTLLPRWMFLLSPGILFLLRPAVGRLPKGIRIIVSGGWTNWISVLYYLAVLLAIL
jgi:Na+-driven multidrug efflux pump